MMNEQQLLTEFLNGFHVPKSQHEPLTRTIRAEAAQVSVVNLQKFMIAASEVLQSKHGFTNQQAREFLEDVTAVFVATENKVQDATHNN